MKKRSVRIAGHATSISLEEEFWQELKLVAASRGLSLNALISAVDEESAGENLSSALRVFVLNCLKKN